MKNLNAAALAEIAKQYGTEPITILQVEWEEGSSAFYADKEIDGFDGRILEVTDIQTALTLENVSTQQVSVTLDDTDSEIKTRLDTMDVHKKPATIYQYYGDLTPGDEFVVFKGQISTPFEWGEKDRQITFTVLSEVESWEVGFSPEEGQLDFVAPDLVGNAWPLAFGNVVHVPATKVTSQESAQLLEPFGIVDPLLFYKLDRIEFAYMIEAFMLKFWILVMRGANALAPDVSWIINEYVKAIIMEDVILRATQLALARLDQLKRIAQKNPGTLGIRNSITLAENDLRVVAIAADMIRRRKKFLEGLCRLAEFEYEVKKKAAQEQIKAYDRMRALHAEFQDTWREICEQSQLFKDCVQTDNGAAVFGTDADVDVLIKGVKWRVRFDTDNVMCFVAGPLSQNHSLEVEEWKEDDEPCSGITDVDGMDLFWLKEENDVDGDPLPAPSLEGQYLLLKKRGTDDTDGCVDRHIVKVTKQKGHKVYFELVEWDRGGAGGFPRAMSLDHVIREIVDITWIPGPFGTPVPLGAYTGDLDPNIWNRPEFAMLLNILAITGPVSKDELTTLAKLVFLLPNDILGDSVYVFPPGPRDIWTIIGPDVEEVVETSGLIQPDWLTRFCIPYEEVPDSLAWSADSGTPIIKDGNVCDIYIANILPSTIKGVYAYRTPENGQRFLAPVPSRYYIKNEAAPLGTITVTSLTFPQPLREMEGEGWEEDVYVTLTSSVGPNVVDIIQHIIDIYVKNKTPNAANFAAVKAKLQSGGDELYPANFALFEKKDALEELRRICWEARLGIFVVGNEFFLKYLSEEPSEDSTIDGDDLELTSLRIEYTRTEDLITVLEAVYKETYLPLEGRAKHPRVVLRHNVKKYGTHKQEEEFHIYNIRELVEKSATFWLIRRANTWKRVKLRAFHTQIPLDVLDTVLFSVPGGHVADSDIKCIVQQAVYSPSNNLISMTLHTGVKAGEMEQYKHFWPADKTPSDFPTIEEVEAGYAGGDGPGGGVTGTIDDCPKG